ncbi:MAG: hypothetical protein GX466_08605 [Candidatus Cloacimonetes bacterium]|nr:hypothetical protein [Candidatus Cloacimonadota bacterium]
MSTADVDQIELNCCEEKVTAVLAGASDFNLNRAIALCERLDLSIYLSEESWKYKLYKRALKQFCIDCSIPVDEEYQVSDQMTETKFNAVEFPVVVKPTDCSSNFGLRIWYPKLNFMEAYKFTKKKFLKRTSLG